MDENDGVETSSRWDNFLIELQPQQLAQIAFSGAIVGVATWLFTLLVRQVVMVPLFCGDPTNGACVDATSIAGYVATIIGGVIGLMALVRFGAFRPLLIVIAAIISLWGLGGWTSSLPWFTALAWSVILYSLVYTAVAWFARIRPFVPAVVVVVVVVVFARILAIL